MCCGVAGASAVAQNAEGATDISRNAGAPVERDAMADELIGRPGFEAAYRHGV